MDMRMFQIEASDIMPRKGRILISSPFFMDYHFNRSVVLIVQHNDEGSMGIVINKTRMYNMTLNDVFPNLHTKVKIPLYRGGPIERDSLFYIHTLDFVKGALSLGNGIYINGEFNDIMDFVNNSESVNESIRFFCGYAGWQHGQLDKEIAANMWIVSQFRNSMLFNGNKEDVWQVSMNSLGGKYQIWSRYPEFPSLN